MRIQDFGRLSLLTSLGAWATGIVFSLLSWLAVQLTYANHQPGDPKPESLLVDIFPVLAALAFPAAVIATIFGIVALFKAQSRVKAAFGILTSIPLFSFLGFGFWVAVNGGV